MRNSPSTARPEFIDNEALHTIRRNADWQKAFIALGLERIPGKSKANDWWAKSPFNPDERTASFHMSSDRDGSGRWYCHSTGQGGGLLDLVQQLQGCNIYEAGRWLVDQHCSHCEGSPALPRAMNSQVEAVVARGEEEVSPEPPQNEPLRQSLVPLLGEQGSHPEFQRRGLSAATCAYLGCGYLPKESKSSLKGRIVFQVRGIEQTENGFQPTILTHIGRATTPAQTENAGKWMFYKGFHKTVELYNLDQALLDPEAVAQAQSTGKLLLVEGPFDVAQCVEAGIKNVVASFGSDLNERQIPRLQLLQEQIGFDEILVWYDRDKAGGKGQQTAYQLSLIHISEPTRR